MKWVDVTDSYTDPKERDNTICDWGQGCNSKAKFRVTLSGGHQRHLCKKHLLPRLEACNYTHTKIEESEKT